MPVVGALALALCCGIPVLLASGLLATAAGVLARFWPLTLLGALALVYGLTKVARRTRRLAATSERHDETRRPT